jgi:hypothetical protein
MKRVILAISAAVFGLTVAVALAFAPIVQPSAATTASAQTVVIDQSPECGAMVNGQWTPNGQCREFADCGAWANDVWSPSGTCQNAHLRLSGTITAVNGSMVTIQQADHSITVNDKPALRNEMSGRVAVGRTVTMHGYWRDLVFFATQIDTIE